MHTVLQFTVLKFRMPAMHAGIRMQPVHIPCSIRGSQALVRWRQVVMVNSSWTRNHVCQLWWKLEPPARVYPPCNTDALVALPLDRKLKRLYLVSVAQVCLDCLCLP